MKQNLYLIIIGAIILLTFSCTNEESINENGSLYVSGGIATNSRTTFIDNGDWTFVRWGANDAIGLFSSDQQNLPYKAVSSGSYSEFVPDGTTTIVPEEGKMVYAYYPYDRRANADSIPLPQTREHLRASNPTTAFLYSKATVNGSTLNFTFKHLFSYLKITINAKQYKDYLENGCVLEDGGLLIESEYPISIRNRSSFNISTEEITHYYQTDNNFMFYHTDDLDYNGTDSYTYLIPILPQPGDTPIRIKLFYRKVDGKSFKPGSIIFHKNTPSDGFLPGNVYAVDLTDNESLTDFYTSTDYSKDGEVFIIQSATEGKGIDLVFIGEGFVDKHMEAGGKYETRMKEAADKLFELEPYKSFRNRFNIYGVKVVSPTAEFVEGAPKRINENSGIAMNYASKYNTNLPDDARMSVAVIYNADSWVGRSYCMMSSTGDFVAYIMTGMDNTFIHEVGGHGIAKLADEYVEHGYENVVFPQEEKEMLDGMFTWDWGWRANIDYRNTASTVRWSRLLNDSRYANDGIGIYEGAFHGKGVYRSSENSMMNHNISWFNAPSREAIYKAVMTLSEGPDWKYDYEEFVKFDAKNINSSSSRSIIMEQSEEEREEIRKYHRAPIFIKGSLRDAAYSIDESSITVPLR